MRSRRGFAPHPKLQDDPAPKLAMPARAFLEPRGFPRRSAGELDRAAKDFRSVTATVKGIDFTAVLNESTTSAGSLAMRRIKNGNEALLKFSEPDPYVLHLSGHIARKYSSRANTAEKYGSDKLAATENMMPVGFGVSASDLRKDYDIRLIGAENVGSVHATRIELTPKSAEVRKNYTARIELWIDGQANKIQEKWSMPSKDITR